jgi:hypothetical protein
VHDAGVVDQYVDVSGTVQSVGDAGQDRLVGAYEEPEHLDARFVGALVLGRTEGTRPARRTGAPPRGRSRRMLR